MAGMKLTQKIVDQWIAECQVAARRVIAEGGELPDFKTLDPRTKDGGSVKSEDWAELSKRPYDTCKCRARTWKDGYSIQCSRSHMEDSDFCKTHHTKHEDFTSKGFALRFGYYDGERPTHWMDREDGEDCMWADTRKSKRKSAKKTKMKKAELMNYLSTRVPNETLKGMKKGELQDLYDKHLEQETSSSDTETEPLSDVEETTENLCSVASSPKAEESPTVEDDGRGCFPPKGDSAKEESEESGIPPPHPEGIEAKRREMAEKESSPKITPTTELDVDTTGEELVIEERIEIVKNSNGSETEIHRHDLVPASEVSEISKEEEEDDGPKTVPEFKKMYKELGIPEEKYKSLRGLKAHQKFWVEYESKSEENSDSESDEEERDLCEIDYDGVEYLEDGDTGEIFNSKKQKIGKWDGNGDIIIWENDTFRIAHEEQCD